ncbi:hypothetical protein NC661_20185 [Aquibacillus koreensis]|uniref:Zinc-ribbon domain-containing protein n=1 Tax=Aquibacillus koreensis TaxID=279446 RepID=A0A9X4AJX2_9BACI|nr:hypothetical protein [Aquibacillus koreensis]MCT2537909.1 hypothetical protein [Aquibacillus koreensis]MDC3422677.1 hypothetical protein [Aquibacillus koreensis]
MYCESCGKQVEKSETTCASCGAKVTKLGEAIARERQMQPQIQPSSKASSKGIVFVVLGWLFFIISLLILPVLFGAIVFMMGLAVYQQRNQMHGVVLMALAVMVIILGFL